MADHVMVPVDGEEVRISSPGRVIFPDRGWTKLNVAEHFAAVGEGAIRGIKDRPTMLKRYMENVDVDPIYQKRANKNAPFDTVQIMFPSQRPGRMNVPRTAADVVRLAQLGCLDFHPWPVRDSDTDHPDELRFDFDPTPGITFSQVKEAAMGSKSLLDELGLVGWPKTSGSRGIHVYVRIEPIWDFFQTRRAVLAFARELERRMDLVTTKWWKEERHGVFIDFNQNARDKSVSSAYGVRPTGYVSAPLTWDELPDVEIEDFPLDRFATERYRAVGDLTEGIDEAVGEIDTLMEWVVRDEENGIGEAPWPPNYPKMPGEPPRVQPSKQRRPDDEY
jgi:bifunctional non-homologous end joining protein LigD